MAFRLWPARPGGHLTASTFGTINSSPWFNLSIAILFVVLGLAMFDVVMIDFSRFLDRFHVGDSNRGSFIVAFGMGAVRRSWRARAWHRS
jgi:thiol:disulfide interchange protein